MEARFFMMPAMRFISLMQIISLLLAANAVQDWKTLSKEENLEMERQLKVINKSPIKSFRTEYGDILDCIDIYKQHAFDHPLLKHHKIKMRPKRIPNKIMGGKSSMETESSLPFLPKNIRCPPGSVLIKRATMEDLIMAKKMKALGLNYPTSSQTKLEEGFAFALAKYTKHNFGAETTINVWHPSVSPNQLSLASLWIANGPVETLNILQAGWEVQPILYSSNYTRLFTFWTADGDNETGCYDYLCPGFVQVSQEVSLGLVLKDISTYNGTQKEIHIGLIKEDSDDWWLKFNNIFVGYWPKSLFNYMYGGANFVAWGGEVCSQDKEPSPAMGSGHLPQDGHYGISAYFKQTQIWDNQQLVNPDAKSVEAYSDKPKCYGAQTNQEGAAIDLFYGGPGNC